MVPFMAEDIYRNLVCTVDKNAPESVHLCDFPVVDESMRDEKLEDEMSFILDAVVLGRAVRNAANIKNRQPLASIYIKTDRTVSDYYRDIVRDELNIKSAEFVPDVSAFSSYSFKPQLKTVGPKYGKLLGKIKAALENLDGNKAMEELERDGALKFDFDGEVCELTREDLLIDVMQKPGYASMADKGITVALDTTLTEELIEEGYLRELLSKVQNLRKTSGFDVADNIRLYVSGDEVITGVVNKYSEYIKTEVLAQEIILSDEVVTAVEDLNSHETKIGVVKL